jgi:hypothetical protein
MSRHKTDENQWNEMLRMLNMSKQHLHNAQAHLIRANGHTRSTPKHNDSLGKFYKNIHNHQNANFLSGNTDFNTLGRRGTAMLRQRGPRPHANIMKHANQVHANHLHRQYLLNEIAKEEKRIRNAKTVKKERWPKRIVSRARGWVAEAAKKAKTKRLWRF